ncbi:MAG: carbohydrate-binding protein [Chitinophagaceae bacterium]
MKKSLLSLFVVGLSLIFSKSANSQNYISGIQVGLGEYVTYFIDNSGTLTAIGNRGYSGVGGNGAGAGSSGVPQAVIVSPSNLKFRSAAGQLHGGAAVDVNGRVWTMGAAAAGESGMGNTNYSQYPQKILTDINGNQFDSVISVVPYAQDYSDGSNRHGWLAVKSTGTLWIWGTPGAMRGDGTENVDQAILRPTKIFIPGGRMVQQIISGDYVLALCTDGTVWTWGKTYRANLGYIPSGMEYASPHQTNLSGITQIAGGKEFNYALKSNGDLYGWGRMGNFMNDPTWPEGTGAEITFPQLMPNIQSYFPAPITKIVTNWSITAALLTDGSLWTWGDNTQGSIGNGESYFGNATTGYVYDYGIHLLRKAPYRVAPTRTFKNIFTGNILGFCTYAVGTDDQLYAWGPNRGSAIPNRIDNPIGGNLGAYNNSWNRPWPQPVDPFNITSTFISTSPLCIANPSGSPCNSYAIPANTKPVANAGSNQSVTGTSAILDGRASTDNVFISYYIWSQVSGPNTAVMDLPGAPVAKVSGLVTGNYVFKLKTIDNGWFSDSTTVQVAVNTTASQPPTANAGTTQTITLPVSQVTLAGNGTANNGGSIINHTWTKFSGGAAAITDPSNYNTTVTGLAAGTYVFRLTVTQNDNQTITSDVTITVNPAVVIPPPTVNAGTTQTITLPASQVTLAGSGTANNGGSIIERTWSKFSGGAANIADPSNYNTTVTGLAAGTYVFRLTVTQNDNQTATSDVTITVNAVNPSGSTPYSGTRKSIPGKLEAEEYDLGGQNIAYNDGTPANLGGAFRTAEGVDVRTCPDAGGGYAIGWTTDGEWMKYSVNVTTSGVYDFAVRAGTPNSGKSVQLQVDDVTVGTLTIVNTGGFNNWQTSTLSNISLTAGDHTFRFLLNTGNVSNPDFGFDINWFSFTIAATPSPTANAGGVQTITLPTTQVTLAGSGTANNGGSIINHTWSKFSGGAAAITDPSNYNTTVTGLAAGTYVFRLTVTQNDNQTATSDVTITVNAVNPSGSTPYGGTRKSIPGKLEAEEYDLGGQNIAYNDGTPSNLGGAFRTAEGVDVRTCPDAGGGYAIGWTTDGEWMKYSVNVTTSGVYDFAVRAGTPNSGKSVQLQVDDVTVGTLTIVNTGGFNTWQTSTLSNLSLSAGNHIFRFLINTGNVSNPDFGFDINWFSFTLASASSVPTANAGVTQTIALPVSQVTLAGNGTANNGGSIINHTWSKFSGGAAAITDPSNYNTTVTGLAAGTYVFRLTVTQNDNQTATSDVTITVNAVNPSGSTPYSGTRKSIPGKLGS